MKVETYMERIGHLHVISDGVEKPYHSGLLILCIRNKWFIVSDGTDLLGQCFLFPFRPLSSVFKSQMFCKNCNIILDLDEFTPIHEWLPGHISIFA